MVLDLLRRTHRWIGLLIALPVALLGLSGAILALADLVPDQRATQAPPRPVGAIVAAAQDATGGRATRYIAPRGSGYVARVEVASPGGKPRTLRIDPATLQIIGIDPQGGGVFGWVRSLHVQFLAADYGGRSIGGWFGVGMLAMLVTAVPIWWPRDGRLKPAFTVDFHSKGAVFHRRLHGAAGAWIIGMLAVLTVTGIVVAFPRTARGVLGLEQRDPPRAGAMVQVPVPAAEIDRAIELAQVAVPNAVPRTVFLPSRPVEATRVVLYRSGNSGARNAIQVQVDSASGGSVRAVDDPSTRKARDGLYRWMHDLHTGGGIGWWWDGLSSIAGLGLFLLSLTGSLMWWRRRQARRRLTRRHRPTTEAEEMAAE